MALIATKWLSLVILSLSVMLPPVSAIDTTPEIATETKREVPQTLSMDMRFGFIQDKRGIVSDTACAECHPRHVRLLHQHLTGVAQAKSKTISQGMINLATECRPADDGSIRCQPRLDANCFTCHMVSVSAATLSLIDLAEMSAKRQENDILGHGCLTCHPPRGKKDHHLTKSLKAITIRASRAFPKGCIKCHGEGLSKVTSGGSPHDWLAQQLTELTGREEDER